MKITLRRYGLLSISILKGCKDALFIPSLSFKARWDSNLTRLEKDQGPGPKAELRVLKLLTS